MKFEIRDNFAFKLSAAKYHIEQIQIIYVSNKSLFNKAQDSPSIRPIHYHYQALVYQIASALEITLQLVNDQEKLGIDVEKVKWLNKTDLKKELKKKNDRVFTILNESFSQEWSSALRETRKHLFHRGNISLQIEFNDEEVVIISPVINGKTYHFDINLWGEKVSELFNKLYVDR